MRTWKTLDWLLCRLTVWFLPGVEIPPLMKSKFLDCNNFSAAVVFGAAAFVSTATPVSTVALLLQELCDSSRVDALVRGATRAITQLKR